MNNVRKIWGEKRNLLSNEQVEIDLLYLDANTACSIHKHEDKINRFVLLSGSVNVKTELGIKKLIINEPFDVEPPMIHQFIVLKKSTMIELAFVKSGWIESNDIIRYVQGGKIISKKFVTLDQLKTKGLLNL